MKNINIHIIMAMQDEAKFIIQKFKLNKIGEQISGVDIYQGSLGNLLIHLFVNQKHDEMDKIGTVQAALLTYKAILFLRPDIILSVGTSGGIHAHQVKLFDVICAQNFVIYHDRFTGDDEKSLKQSLGFLPCIDYKKHIGTLPFHTVFQSLKYGVIASSNSLLVDSYSWKLLYKYNVLCVDMEAASVAEVARTFSIPFSAFKVVTDNVYEINPVDALSQFLSNFDAAMQLLAEKLFEILSYSSVDSLIGSGSNSVIVTSATAAADVTPYSA